MRAGVTGFLPDRLLQARLSRGLTQTALSTMIGRSSPSISKWERGEQAPEPEALDKLSAQLAIPAPWFLRPLAQYGERVCFYRSNASVTKDAQLTARIRLQWLNEISMTLQTWIDWPTVNVPHLDERDHKSISDVDIESIASECRRVWNLGLGPISDVVLALENAGVICVREELGFVNMDGASRWFESDDRPYVYLSSDKANGVRSRFDAAHELGHLVLHRFLDSIEFNKRYADIERQAHLFAGAFLLPAESFAAEVLRPSLETFLTLKPRWKVSIAAMIMRCKQLNIIDDEYTTRLWKNYSARGWRRGEPHDEKIVFEPIRLLPRAVNLLISQGGVNRETLALAFGLGARDCEQLCSLPEGFFEKRSTVTDLGTVRLKRPSVEVGPGNTATVIGFPPAKS